MPPRFKFLVASCFTVLVAANFKTNLRKVLPEVAEQPFLKQHGNVDVQNLLTLYNAFGHGVCCSIPYSIRKDISHDSFHAKGSCATFLVLPPKLKHQRGQLQSLEEEQVA